jgi:hypothetical protein
MHHFLPKADLRVLLTQERTKITRKPDSLDVGILLGHLHSTLPLLVINFFHRVFLLRQGI